MLIAGSSAGSEDFTPALMEELGELLVHGITVMPGKPALLAAADGRPVVGIPGYPVSAACSLKRRTSHFAGSHLLDTATGDYNVSYVRRYLPGMPVACLEDEKILLLLDIIRSDAFKEMAMAMGGYAVNETGNVVNQI